MPYKCEKIKIAGSDKDRRIKLDNEKKDKIIDLRGKISTRACATLFGVSKRTIQFLWDPEKLENCKKRRQERGGSKVYYDKDKQRDYMKSHRHYKQELYLRGEIK